MEIADFIEPLGRVHDTIRGMVATACETRSQDELTTVSHDGTGDITYEIDRISEDVIVDWFVRELADAMPIILIGEGLPNGCMVLPVGANVRDARWQVIVDPIDGTRGLMYQKRPGWILTGIAPNRGEATTIADIELAFQTEIPLVKQHLCDQLWAVRSEGVQGVRKNRLTNESRHLVIQPSRATELRHGFATICRFFPGGRDVLAALDEELCDRVVKRRNGEAGVFEDQYASTGGQLYGLTIGQDRFVADLRPLVERFTIQRGLARGHCCHPYDICTKLIAEEAGVIITAPNGKPLSYPLDTTSNVAWIGYANHKLQLQIEPVFQELLEKFRLSV